MSPTSLLATIRSAGGSVRLLGDQLKVSAPSGLLDQEERSVLVDSKADLLRLLARERIGEILDRFARERPRSYSSTPDADQWDRIEAAVDAALRSGTGLDQAIEAYEREGLALLLGTQGTNPKQGKENLPSPVLLLRTQGTNA